MANGQLKSKDVYQADLYADLVKSADQANKILLDQKQHLTELQKLFNDLGVKSVADVKKLTAAEKEARIATEAKIKTEKANKTILTEIEKLERRLADAKTENAEKTSELRVQLQEQNKLNKEEAKDRLGLLDAYQKQSKKLIDLRKEYKAVATSEGLASKNAIKLRKEVIKLDRELKDVDESAGQFQRNVGNYPQAMKQASGSIVALAAAAGLATSELTDLGKVAKGTDEGAEDAAEAVGFFEGGLTALRAAGGKAFGAIKNLVSGEGGLRALLAVSNALDLEKVAKDILKTGEAFSDAEKKALAFQKSILQTNRDIQDLTNVINEQNAIAGDNTRTFDEIERAVKRAQAAEVERAAKLLSIAQQERDILKEKVDAATEEANILSLEIELNEKEIELSQIQNDLAVASIENEKALREVRRDRFERELDFAIDAFDSQKAVNERIIADETKTFDERSKLFVDTVRLSDKAFSEQIKLVEGYTKEKIDFDALVKESDESVIRGRLEGLALDDVVLGRTLEIIREQKIARQDLAELERDLREESKENAAEAADFINQLEQAQFEGKLARLERLDNQTEGTLNESLELRKGQLEAQAEFELSLEETTAEEKELIRENLANEIEALEAETADKIKKLREDELKAEQDALKKRIDGYKTFADQVNNVISQISDNQARELDVQINQNSEALSAQEQRAQAGLQNELGFRRKQAAQLEEERERQAKATERRAKVLAYFNLFAENAKQNPDSAAAKSLAQVALAETLVGFFNEGTESIGDDTHSKWRNTGTDDYLAAVHKGERILTADQNKLVGSLSNEELAKLAFQYQNGMLQPNVSATVLDDSRIVNELKGVRQSVGNIKLDVHFDELGNAIISQVNGKIKKVIHEKTGGRFRP